MRSGSTRALATLLAIAVLPLMATAAVAEPVAVLVKLEGAVQVQRTGADAPVPATVGMPLSAGDRVLPAAGGRAVLLHSTGRTQIAAEAVTVQAAGEAQRAGVFTRAVRTIENVAASSAKTDPNRQGMIRPIPGTPVPVAPRNGILVAETRPRLTWMRVPGVDSYMLQIRAEGQRPVRYEVGGDTTWMLAADAPALEPGLTYHWTVGSASGGARVAETVTFQVADSAVLADIAAAMAVLRDQGLDPEGDGAFLAALLYHDAGLAYEADRLLTRLQGTGADEGRTFHLLRGEVYDALGDLDAAARAFALADAASSE